MILGLCFKKVKNIGLFKFKKSFRRVRNDYFLLWIKSLEFLFSL